MFVEREKVILSGDLTFFHTAIRAFQAKGLGEHSIRIPPDAHIFPDHPRRIREDMLKIIISSEEKYVEDFEAVIEAAFQLRKRLANSSLGMDHFQRDFAVIEALEFAADILASHMSSNQNVSQPPNSFLSTNS